MRECNVTLLMKFLKLQCMHALDHVFQLHIIALRPTDFSRRLMYKFVLLCCVTKIHPVGVAYGLIDCYFSCRHSLVVWKEEVVMMALVLMNSQS